MEFGLLAAALIAATCVRLTLAAKAATVAPEQDSGRLRDRGGDSGTSFHSGSSGDCGLSDTPGGCQTGGDSGASGDCGGGDGGGGD